MELSNEARALELMHQALNHLRAAKDVHPSRQLSIVVTELEGAMLWLKFDLECKTPQNDVLRVEPGDVLTST